MSKKVIVSGGGTGGHIFPALSIANALKRLEPGIDILFVGAEGKMEMEKVPEAGYPIEGLPVRGFQRKLTLGNIKVLVNLWRSLRKAKKIIKKFQPDVVVGVGGYASGPIGQMATKAGIPLVLQEQNSYAGVTNKILAKKARRICVAYEGMERFFETLNKAMLKSLDFFSRREDVQVLWQCGSYYYENLKKELEGKLPSNVKLLAFLKRMDLAYACADVVVARAGAGTISELCLLEKAALLIPSPNVAEDHQTKNALALVDKDAAIYVKDMEAQEKLLPVALATVKDSDKLKELSNNIAKLALPDSATIIAKEVLKLIK